MLSPRWQHAPLSGDGAARNGGRWNARGIPALYLSSDHATAIAEYMQALIHPGTLTPYELDVAAVLDLTDSEVRALAGVDDAILTLPWRRLRDIERVVPDSWLLATAAAEAGFDALLAPSVVGRGANLVLWRWGDRGAKIEVVDPADELHPR